MMGLMAGSLSLYDVLGVDLTAPPEALRKAWKRRVLETHPDKLAQDLSEDERRIAESKFREVHQAFEILSDPAKRRVYDNGLNFLRGRIKKNEAQERLARTREEWDRQCKQRQEERIRLMRDQQEKAREERERLRQEKLRQMDSEKLPDDYEEKKRVLTEEIRASQERYRDNLMAAEMKYRERIKKLEEELIAKRKQLQQESPIPRIPIKPAQGSLATVSEMLQTDSLLQQLRDANPEWEVRRQAALRVGIVALVRLNVAESIHPQRKAQRTTSAQTI
ncbi:hypothetical protein BC835DRAFT_1316659 [Cytidiella melzeri]|nr:hypothetical protein BC835DRAFT_1316659 [Cytidiella melzeri]